jgi:Outer membrane protein beta-barrel domain
MRAMRAPRVSSFVIVALTVLAVAPGAARARTESPPDSGLELGLRLGLSLPFGSIDANNSLDRIAGSAVPLVVEAGYRATPNLFLGARFQYAFPQLKNPAGTCGGNTSCDGSDVVLGVEGIYRFLASQTFAPWVGLGVGYEWLSVDYSSNNVNVGAGATDRGIQPLAQIGGDVRVTPHLVLGPYLEAAFGRFNQQSVRTRLGNGTTETDSDIGDTAWHTWVTLGVRGAFGI